MKLYRIGQTHVSTQPDAKAASKAQGVPWLDVEVPTDKIGLLAYLNALTADGAATITGKPELEIMLAPELFQSSPPVTPASAEASQAYAAKVERDLSIEDAILAADYPRALYLASCIHTRLMEHAELVQRTGGRLRPLA